MPRFFFCLECVICGINGVGWHGFCLHFSFNFIQTHCRFFGLRLTLAHSGLLDFWLCYFEQYFANEQVLSIAVLVRIAWTLNVLEQLVPRDNVIVKGSDFVKKRSSVYLSKEVGFGVSTPHNTILIPSFTTPNANPMQIFIHLPVELAISTAYTYILQGRQSDILT